MLVPKITSAISLVRFLLLGWMRYHSPLRQALDVQETGSWLRAALRQAAAYCNLLFLQFHTQLTLQQPLALAMFP